MKHRTFAEKRFFEWHEDDVAVSLRASSGSYGGGSEVLIVSYQEITGSLMANSHPGSYCGQDAYNDMLVVDNAKGLLHRERSSGPTEDVEVNRGIELYARSAGDNYRGGGTEMNKVRRLTPLECERLQGFPDGWTDIGDWIDSKGKLHKGDSDAPRYKALGNSIALPFWFYLLRRISAQYERPATLGSLFDGISGFPLVWAKCNGGPEYCLWSSEIDEFAIAVCKKHFGDEDAGIEGDYHEAIQRKHKKEDV